jgi:predicted transcriptional regulator
MVKMFKENDLGNEDKVYHTLLEHKQGATITELTELSNIPRSAVRIQLARLEGANKVTLRKIGMAKVYTLNQDMTSDHAQFGIKNGIKNANFIGDLNQ